MWLAKTTLVCTTAYSPNTHLEINSLTNSGVAREPTMCICMVKMIENVPISLSNNGWEGTKLGYLSHIRLCDSTPKDNPIWGMVKIPHAKQFTRAQPLPNFWLRRCWQNKLLQCKCTQTAINCFFKKGTTEKKVRLLTCIKVHIILYHAVTRLCSKSHQHCCAGPIWACLILYLCCS